MGDIKSSGYSRSDSWLVLAGGGESREEVVSVSGRGTGGQHRADPRDLGPPPTGSSRLPQASPAAEAALHLLINKL